MKTTFMQEGANEAPIYCHKLFVVLPWTMGHFHDECVNCPYYNGNLQTGDGIECRFESGTEDLIVTDASPYQLYDRYGFKDGKSLAEPLTEAV